MDKSLDDIISAKPKAGRRGGRARSSLGTSGRQEALGKRAAAPAAPATRTRAQAAVQAKAATAVAAPTNADKIIVSNLPIDVTQEQIKDLFTSTVGPLRDVTLHYDANGKSKGVAAVQFSRKGDANKAYQQYNSRLIDGKRPMKIEVVIDPFKAVPLSARVAPAPAASAPAAQRNGAAGAKGKRRGARGGGGGGAKRAPRPPKTAADLDAEMEDYTASASAPAAAPAAAA
ncbi:RNA annealing factor [Coprinopsis sp. MPI-PUGE-AT-0042]|nr:RNA annealing factor [Coprinopsis sp. MPI-PUGE-AT-0042]